MDIRAKHLWQRTTLVAAATLAAGWVLQAQTTTTNWSQWGQNSQHQGVVDVVGQPIASMLSDIVYDPLVPQEQAATGGELLAHYQVPILDGQDVFMEFKTGDYSNPFNSQIWHQRRLHWQGSTLATVWDFTTDWKPEPINFVGGWEPVYHAVLANGFVYDMGAGGTLFKLDRGSGAVVSRINPFGGTIDPNTFVSGPPSADNSGNVYYNVIQLDNTESTIGSWLVKVTPDDTISKVSYTTLIPDAPTMCIGRFLNADLPWPPSPTATPDTAPHPNPPFPCGMVRAGVNVSPAVAPDGTIYTVARTNISSRYNWMVAVNPDLSEKWRTSGRNLFTDGCGVLVPIAPTKKPAKGSCNGNDAVIPGVNFGFNPETNRPGDMNVLDQSSSSPTVLPDGNVLYGSYTRYNAARGHLVKFNGSTGAVMGFFDFGWDNTPAVYSHDGTYSIVLKDNHYDEELGFYCNPTSGDSLIVCAFTGIPAGPFYITQLNASLTPEWKFHSIETNSCVRQPDGSLKCTSDHPNGFEWCINAPGLDANRTVYVESEDGHAYVIPQGHTGVFDMNTPGVQRLFLQLALGAAYTPLSIGPDGKIYTQNAGHLFVLGSGGR
jgi:hypothetical protein